MKNKVELYLNPEYKEESQVSAYKITEVLKRDGTIEAFDPAKPNGWAHWGCRISKVSWSPVVLGAVKKLHAGRVDSEDLQEALIKTAAELITTDVRYDEVAKQLYLAALRKRVYDSFDAPSLQYWHDYLVSVGTWSNKREWISDKDFAKLALAIDHSRDELFSYGGLKQFSDKYARRNIDTDEIYETPQFAYMGIAMEMLSQKDWSVDDAIALYDAISLQKINVPTPPLVGLRSGDRGFASCCLVDGADTQESIATVNHVIFMMTAARAGIGAHQESRSIADPVRDGAFPHSGKLPYYRMFDRAVKASTQQSRGGSATVSFAYFDPEVISIIHAKKQRTADDKRIDKLDYCLNFNSLLLKKYMKGEDVALLSYHYAPEVHEAFYSGDEATFEKLYNEAVIRLTGKTTAGFKGETRNVLTYAPAKLILEEFMSVRSETGRMYAHNVAESNRHGTFLDPIRMTNLCVEVVQPTRPFHSMEDLYRSSEYLDKLNPEDIGEVSLCNLAGFVLGRIQDTEWEDIAYITLKFVDTIIDIQDYAFPTVKYTANKRRNVAIGLINVAGAQAALGFNYEGEEARNWIHEQTELYSFNLHKASVRLARERGAAGWFNRTKYAQGVLPIDTYKKTVDELVSTSLKCDWESLRKDIVKYGMRNSVLEACMPSESSAVLISATNGIEPIRGLVVAKGSGVNTVLAVAPGAADWNTSLSYKTAFEIDNLEYIKFVAVVQKFLGQSISTNEYYDYRKFPNEKIPMDLLIRNFFQAVKYGYKTWYYMNTDVSNGGSTSGCVGGGCTL
jgi:ribonucleoside-diphosphate reductase alpha chain